MTFWKPFCTGAIVSASTVLIFQKYYYDINNNNNKKKNNDESTTNSFTEKRITQTKLNNTTTNTKVGVLLDSPELDMRMIRKAEGVIQKRTSRITLVIERCTNDHNYSAILRTAEALGIQNVWIISPPPSKEDDNKNEGDDEFITTMRGTKIKQMDDEREGRKLHHLYAQRATEWLTVRDEFTTTQECYDELRRTDHTIWATDLSQQAVCLSNIEELPNQVEGSGNNNNVLPSKLAIVFGTEAVGCSSEALLNSDLRVYLPLRGFADSLNLSVATALVLHQLFVLDPTIEGDSSEEERVELRRKWFTKLAGKRLLTSRQKKDRTKLISTIEHCRALREKKQNELTIEQLAKLKTLSKLEQDLSELERSIQYTAEEAVSEFIDNPPSPITDLRRPDEHRVAHVSKNTKAKNLALWDNNNEEQMPATTSYQTNTHPSTSNFFRNRISTNNVTRKVDIKEKDSNNTISETTEK
mmetsp:Transcript_7788/g.8924  ORF Transcript_7788/g.8924 Transcript_7788/m.8924 type:complete len:470 (-) Transcript_7788:161-1570(-)|eukprot:CAMPEP_0194189534 /NCGR_PEP_ID=MMETSP0154-20130528/59443_1 /TAXON_ID=1049557 /ORGANISM="Thalassiothrix antarctica, Strain L6-D1" /LENGTH=469 /DNA_ID=CAMNT_0038910763 /DNA_START=28 /DNA_END=1437 /DNA_ORIENTATION=-